MAAFAKKLKLLQAARVPRSAFLETAEEDSGDGNGLGGDESESQSVNEDDSSVGETPQSKSLFPFRRKKQAGSEKDSPRLGSRRSSILNLGQGRGLSTLFKKTAKEHRRHATQKGGSVRPPSKHVGLVHFDSSTSHLDSQGSVHPDRRPPNRLKALERGTFDLKEEIRGLDEGGIEELRNQLADAKQECGEKIKMLLHQHYPAFIMASKGIRAMDSEIQALRVLLNRENALLNSLKEIADPRGSLADRSLQATPSEAAWTRSWEDSPEGIRWHEALQKLDVAIAEKRPADALPLLKQAEKALLPGQKSGLYSHSLDGGPDVKTEQQSKELARRRQRLGDLVTVQITHSSVGSYQMQLATQVLASLSGRAHALKKHLETQTLQMRRSVNQLLKTQNAGGDADGTEFSNALAQHVFTSIGAAAEEVMLIFGKELKELASIFLVWALTETEKCSLLLKRNALSPFAAPAGLGPTVHCCLMANIHCLALQSSHSLCLSPRLMRDLWPSCDQVLQRRVKRIVDDIRAAIVTEVEALVEKGLPAPSAAGGWSDLMQIFPSADLLLDELEAVVKILGPMAGPRVREALSHAITRLFREYTNAITAQFARYRDKEGALPQVLDEAIEPALEVAHSLLEQFLPDLTEPLQARCGQICKHKVLYEQLNTFQDNLLPEDPDEIAVPAEKDHKSGEEELENGSADGSARKRSPADWRKHQLQPEPSEGKEEDPLALAEAEFVPGQEASSAVEAPPLLLTSKSINRLGQIMSNKEGLQTVGRVNEQAAKQEIVRLNQMPSIERRSRSLRSVSFKERPDQIVEAVKKLAPPSHDLDDLEEMSEELSDFDEDEMIAQLTKKR